MTTTAAAAAAAASATDIVPKSVITIGILIAAFIIGFAIAKLANYCYHRADVPDNASDISDHTKNLLRIQLAMLKLGKRSQQPADTEEAKREQQATVLNMWKMKAMNKAAAHKAEEEEKVKKVDETQDSGGEKKPSDGKEATKETGKKSSAKLNNSGDSGTGAKANNAVANKPGTAPPGKPKKLFPNSVTAAPPKAVAAQAGHNSAQTDSQQQQQQQKQQQQQPQQQQQQQKQQTQQQQQKPSRPTTAASSRKAPAPGTQKAHKT